MKKITMIIEDETMEQAMETYRRIIRRGFKQVKAPHEALIVAEGKSKKMRSRPKIAGPCNQSLTSTPSTSS